MDIFEDFFLIYCARRRCKPRKTLPGEKLLKNSQVVTNVSSTNVGSTQGNRGNSVETHLRSDDKSEITFASKQATRKALLRQVVEIQSSVIASLQIHMRTESANPSQAYTSTMSWRTTIFQVKWPKENGSPTMYVFLPLELTRKSTGRRCLKRFIFFECESTLLPKVATSQIFLSSTYIVREHALAGSRVHLRQHGALSWARTCTHPWARITSLSFLRLLSKQFSCHLALFSCHNKSQRPFFSKKKKKKKKNCNATCGVWTTSSARQLRAWGGWHHLQAPHLRT